MSEPIRLNVNGQFHEYPRDEIVRLVDLRNHPGWEVFVGLLARMDAGTREALESPDQPLDTIRGLQGRLSVVRDLRRMVEDDLPQYLREAASKEN